MSSINFVPDDYIQNSESHRANLLCVILLVLVMAGLVGAFVTIKVRQKACAEQEAIVNKKMTRMQEAIKQFEELQVRRKEMMKTALTTAELIEPVPRRIMLATLTNNLPNGTSLVGLDIVQKDSGEKGNSPEPVSHYAAAKQKNSLEAKAMMSPEKRLVTYIDIGGMAPTDLQVAAFIERLANCSIMDSVALVESKEHKLDDDVYREFHLTARLCKNVQLTQDDIEQIRVRAEKSIYKF